VKPVNENQSRKPARKLQQGLAALVSMLSIIGIVLLSEGILRAMDGQPLTQAELGRSAPRKPPPIRPLVSLATTLTTDPQLKPAWIDEPPPPISTKGHPDLALETIDAGQRSNWLREQGRYRQYNARWLRHWGCKRQSHIDSLPQPVLVFDAPRSDSHPAFRYLQSYETPTGFITNRFGWRGPNLPLDKPSDTIRIAFVGASTTVGQPDFEFSYPEFVVHWLNLWAADQKLDLRFDGINAGRAGISSASIAAIVETEVLPMEPDLVLYYEGSNQFSLASLLDVPVEVRTVFHKVETPKWRQRLVAAERYSILVGKLRQSLDRLMSDGGAEPEKPDYQLRWPDGLDEFSPQLDHPKLPVNLSAILIDLEKIRLAVEDGGADFALGSFVWLAYEGLRVDPVRQSWFLHFFNTRYWPYRYTDIRRLADFQNRVLQAFARTNELLFLKVAEAYPQQPDLFIDGIHFSSDGTRLQAWIVLQNLLPQIRERLDAGDWPRPDQTRLRAHPAIGTPRPISKPCENLGQAW
jgi:hypothetical protein